MTQQERQQVGELMAIMSAYYGKDLRPQVLSLMLDDLDDLSGMAVMSALTAYRRDPKNRTFPVPAQLRSIVAPEMDPEAAAREIAARITAAIPKFGWANGLEAKAFIGDRGWGIVERQGGWRFLCEHHGLTIDPTSFQAQIREQAKADLKYTPQAMAQAIGLAPASPDIRALASSIIKDLE